MSVFQATPTMWDAMQSQAYVTVLAGPVGSGKSVCACHRLVQLAIEQEPNAEGLRKTRSLIVRNTADQLRSTTMKTFLDWFPPGVWGLYKASERTFFMDLALGDNTRVKAEFMFIALDTPDDVRKALSLEATFLWGNEWRELHPDVVDGLLMRLRRYPSKRDGGPTRSCAIFDTNMPDMDSWHYDKMEHPPANWAVFIQPPAVVDRQEYIARMSEDPPAEEAIVDTQRREWWINPLADNLDNLDENYYQDILPGKSDDFVDVYLRCRYGRSLAGVPVYDKTFVPEFHIVRGEILPLKSADYPVIIGLDFGRTPAAVLMQRTVSGRLLALAEVVSVNMGIETFLNTKLRPLLAAEFSGCTFLVAPDPAGWSKQQIGEISPVDVVKRAGFKVVKPATNDPERRIQAVERALMGQVDGKPLLGVAERCTVLVKGFRFGYRYKLNRAGMQDNKPEKNEFSHPHDALEYACLVAEGNQLLGSYPGMSPRREVKRIDYMWA